MTDMTKRQTIAQQKIHQRPTGTGRLAGRITVVTGGRVMLKSPQQALESENGTVSADPCKIYLNTTKEVDRYV